jgi:citrate synthase
MVLRAPSSDIMNKLARSTLVCYSYDDRAEERRCATSSAQCIDLIARFPAMIAYSYQAKRHYFDNESLYIHAPDRSLSCAENFLQMIRPDRAYTPLEARRSISRSCSTPSTAEGNNSAFTIHVVSSAATDTYSAVAAAVGSLKGAKHGGANNRVMAMMDDIKANVGDWTDAAEVQRLPRTDHPQGSRRRSRSDLRHGPRGLHRERSARVLLKEKAETLAREKGSGPTSSALLI